jgi:L-methionine (R)-S-oxide reductase
MSSQPRLTRERAKEMLAELDSLASKAKGQELRKQMTKALNKVPTYSWVGIYLVKGNDLHLDAWSGPAPTIHTTIPIGKGVCGWAAKSGRTEIVSDVSKEPRYVKCFENTMSEIVVPVVSGGKVVAEIDIDSDQLNAHSSVDREFLEAVASKIVKSLS